MKKRFFSALTSLAMTASFVVGVMPASPLMSVSAAGIVYEIGKIQAEAGQTASVPVTVTGDTGTAGITMRFDVDSSLKYVRRKDGTAYTGAPDWNTDNYDYVWNTGDGKNVKAADGAVITYINFTVPATAKEGDKFPISFVHDTLQVGDSKPRQLTESVDQNGTTLDIDYVDGYIYVGSTDPGTNPPATTTTTKGGGTVTPSGMTYTIGQVAGEAGQTASVPVTVTGDTGTAGITMRFDVDSALKYVRRKDGNAYTGAPDWNTDNYDYVWNTGDGKNVKAADGAVITYINFTVPATAKDGDKFPISFVHDTLQVGDSKPRQLTESVDQNGTTLGINYVDGYIYVGTAPVTETTTKDPGTVTPSGMSYTIGQVAGDAGATVSVPITVKGDTGTAGITMRLDVDSALKYVRRKDGTAYTGAPDWNTENYDYVWNTGDGKNVKAADGAVITYINFTIPATAKDGDKFPISFVHDTLQVGDSKPRQLTESVDQNGTTLDINYVDGYVYVGTAPVTETTTKDPGTVTPSGMSYAIGQMTADAGETVSVPITVKGDTGSAGIVIRIAADDALTYVRRKDGNAYTGSPEWNAESFDYVWNSSDGQNCVAADGAVITYINFTVPATAKDGDKFPITFVHEQIVPEKGDTRASTETVDVNGKVLNIDYVDGYILVGKTVETTTTSATTTVGGGTTSATKATTTTVKPTGGDVTYTIGEVKGEAGKTVKVPVTVSGDPGTAGIVIGLIADAQLTNPTQSNGNAYTGSAIWNVDALTYVWATDDGMNQKAANDAVIFTVEFTVPATAQPGDEFPITFASAEAVNTIGGNLNVTTQSGKVYIPAGTTTNPNVGTVTYTIGKVKAAAGDTVEVPVSVTGDPGTAGIIIGIDADGQLVYASQSNGAAYAGTAVWNANPMYYVWASADGMNYKATDNAVIFNVSYTVPATAQPGDEFPITFASAEAVNTIGVNLNVVTVDGMIYIPEETTTNPNVGTVTYTIAEVPAAAGETVEVPVSVTGDPGTAGIVIGITADGQLVYASEANGAAYAGTAVWNANPMHYVWASDDGMNRKAADDAVIFTVSFTVPATAQPGDEFPITFDSAEATNTIGQNLNVVTVDGMIYIPKTTTETSTDVTSVTSTDETTTSSDDSTGTSVTTVSTTVSQSDESGTTTTSETTTNDGKETSTSVIVPTGLTYTIAKVPGVAGETVEVPVSVTRDPGTAGIVIGLTADGQLVYANETNGSAYTGTAVWNADALSFVWASADGMNSKAADDAVIFTVSFTVPATAQPGDEFPITFASAEAVDTNGTALEASTVDGMIYIPIDETSTTTSETTTATSDSTTETSVTTVSTTVSQDDKTSTVSETTTNDGKETSTSVIVPTGLTYTIAKVKVTAGATVEVPVSVTGDPGTAGIVIGLDADAQLTYADFGSGSAYAGTPVWDAKEMYYVWASANGLNQNAENDAVIFNVSFTVPENAQPGDEFPITFETAEAVDTNGTPLNVTTVNGMIYIIEGTTTSTSETVTSTVVTTTSTSEDISTTSTTVTSTSASEEISTTTTTVTSTSISDESGTTTTVTSTSASEEISTTTTTVTSTSISDESGTTTTVTSTSASEEISTTTTTVTSTSISDESGTTTTVTSTSISGESGTTVTTTSDDGQGTTTTAEPGSVTYTIATVPAMPGETVFVPVSVKGDTGTAGIVMGLNADEALLYAAERAGNAYTGTAVWTADQLYWAWSSADGMDHNAKDDAVLFYVSFTVPDNAQPGDKFDINFGDVEAVDTFGTPLEVTTVDGYIYIPTDIETTTTTSATTTDDSQGGSTTTTSATTTDDSQGGSTTTTSATTTSTDDSQGGSTTTTSATTTDGGQSGTTTTTTSTTNPDVPGTTVVTSVSISFTAPDQQCYWSHDDHEYVTSGMEVLVSIWSTTVEEGATADFTGVEPTIVDLTDDCTLSSFSPKETYVPGKHKYPIAVTLTNETYGLNNVEVGTFQVYIGLKGDALLNEDVTVLDAVLVLKYYAVGLLNQVHPLNADPELDGKDGLVFYLSDVDSDKDLDVFDGVFIMKYYAIWMLRPAEASWVDVVGFETFPYDSAHQELD